MHPDLVKLLELQDKDLALEEVDQRLAAIQGEAQVLDDAVAESQQALAAARQAASDATERRKDLEAKIETYRVQQERRRQRLEITRPGKEAANLMAELDLARSVLAQEESEWVRLADTVAALETKATEAEERVASLLEEQVPEREALKTRQAEILKERDAKAGEREASATRIDKPLLTKYDRLRRVRSSRVVVAMNGPACGACFTSLPLQVRSEIKAGTTLGWCEVCGVILYDDNTTND